MKNVELKNIITVNGKYYLVSTISMQIRHKFFEKDDNLLVYETMVFEIKNDNEVLYSKPLYNERYVTADEAVAEHKAIIENPSEFLYRKCKID